MSQPGRDAAIDFGLQMQFAMNVTDRIGQSIVPKSHNPILLNRHAAAKVVIPIQVFLKRAAVGFALSYRP